MTALLDMTSPEWTELDVAEQSRRAAAFQKSYAAALGIPTEVTVPFEGSSFQFVLIPPGRFLMGASEEEDGASKNEQPQHAMVISEPFWLGKFPVTQQQWLAVVGERPWAEEQYAIDNERCPATCVSWDDITTKWLSRPGCLFQLPSEPQWEFACRAGTTTRFYWGDDPDLSQISNHAWFEENTWRVDEKYPHAVGEKRSNAWGLFDMSGNVLEWCVEEVYRYDNQPAAIPGRRVVRGGYWSFWATRCRSAYRCSCPPFLRDCLLGFRLSARFDALRPLLEPTHA